MPKPSSIAVIVNRDDLDAQALLSGAAASWRAAGIKVAGVLAENNTGEGMCSAGLVRDWVSKQAFSIQLAAPPSDSDCHIDASGLEQAAASLLAQIPAADVVILSKFGKLEAAHGGLWPVFQAAMAAGKPLLTTVSPKHLEAWSAFAPMAVRLAGEPDSIARWWRTSQA